MTAATLRDADPGVCTSKRRFPSKREAISVANRIEERLRRRKHSKTLRIYLCPFCRGWHLTSRRQTHKRKDWTSDEE